MMKIEIIKAPLSAYEEIVDMYVDLIDITYPKRVKKEKFFYYRNVYNWFVGNSDIYVTVKDRVITGFLLMTIDDVDGVTEKVLNAEIVYVKPEYRNGKSSYLLYNKVIELATINGMATTTTANDTSADILKDRFNTEVLFHKVETYSTRGIV